MRKIDYLVVHCTATSQNAKVESIINYWRHVLKWKSNGYHYVIEKTGKINKITDEEKICNGVKNHNSNSIHVAYIGGVDDVGRPLDNRTLSQRFKMLYLLRDLKNRYPQAAILGHRDFPNVKKACPCFNAKKEFSDLYEFI